MCWPKPSHASEDLESILTCVKQTDLMTARTHNVSQHVLTNLIICQRGHRMYLNMCWQSPSHASDETKCISTCVDQTPPISETIDNVSQYVLSKLLPCQRGHKTFLIMCWPTPSHISEVRYCIATYVDQILPITAQTQNVSHLVLTNNSHASEDKNISHLVLTKGISCLFLILINVIINCVVWIDDELLTYNNWFSGSRLLLQMLYFETDLLSETSI